MPNKSILVGFWKNVPKKPNVKRWELEIRWLMRCCFFILNLIFVENSLAQGRPPIIDFHIHSYSKVAAYGIDDPSGNKGPQTQRAHFEETYERLRKFNIVKAVVSGPLDSVDQWKAWDHDNRIIRGLWMMAPNENGIDSKRFEQLVKEGKIEVFGEIGAHYSGSLLSDPEWLPYMAICEKYDIPVAVHTGGGAPGGTYTWAPNARLSKGDPYLFEEVLIKHPKLRIILMHAGEEWHEHTLRMMDYYPQVYADLGVLLWLKPLTQRYAEEFLRKAKQAGFLDRVLFGTDQMYWPDAIDRSIVFLESLSFLTDEERTNILYNNAAHFLKLNEGDERDEG